MTLVNGPMDFDGTLVDVQGRVLGMWASFAYQTGRDLTQVNMGIPADVVVDMIENLRAREPLRSIEVEWQRCRSRPRARWICRRSGCGATRRTTRRAARC